MNDRYLIGTRTVNAKGYVYIKLGRGHAGWVLEHVAVVERVLGKALPNGAVVHHVDDDGTHNENSNLAALQNDAEHKRLHARRRVLRAGGNQWSDRWCSGCRAPRPAADFSGRARECRSCANVRRRVA